MALRHAARTNPVRGRPRIDLVRRAARKLGGLRRGPIGFHGPGA